MADKQVNYLNNPNLKKANVPVEFTEEQVQEYVKCAKDLIYFVENYVKIINIDEGLVNFELYPYQKKMLGSFMDNRFTICKLPRQSGKSVTVTAFMLWIILFQSEQSIAILANKERLARELLGKIQLAYEHLPLWLQQGVVEWNKGSILLENNSKIIAAATSSSAVRGGSYNLLFLDEFAFINDTIATEFFASVYPTISSGKESKVIIVSTPKGMNHFYKMWVDAIEGHSEYNPIEIVWNEVPGRDQNFKKTTIKNTSEEQWMQEFECEFLGSQNTLINPTKLRQLIFHEPLKFDNYLKIFKEPELRHSYLMIADVSRGVGHDASAFVVLDVTKTPYHVVATYKNDSISPLMYPELLTRVARNYNDSYILVEINDIGQQVADIIQLELEYENLLMTTMRGRSGQTLGGGFGGNVSYGVRTTKSVKKIGCSNLKDLIESDQVVVNDIGIIVELSNFVSRAGSYGADDGQHDDLAMCLVLFGWVARQEFFKQLTDTDFRDQLKQERLQLLEDDLLPFGIKYDAADEYNSDGVIQGRGLEVEDIDPLFWR
jgi:hypothetical protein